jgi:hypothetical protein
MTWLYIGLVLAAVVVVLVAILGEGGRARSRFRRS